MTTSIEMLGIGVDSRQVKTAITDLDKLAGASGKAESATNSLVSAVKILAGSYVALKALQYAKDAAMMAARYETLGVVMNVVGRNVGYTSTQMDTYSKALQKNGIAMVESRSVLTKMAQAHIDLSKATELSRIAQDAAVIGNINSSEAFERMIYGIQSGQTEVLKTIGINVSFESSYKTLAAQLGKNAKDLTELEKMQARTNVVMEAGTAIAGTYEAAMGTAGKMLNSLSRYFENIKVLAGEAFGPAMTMLIEDVTGASKDLETSLKNNKKGIQEWGQGFRTAIIAIKTDFLQLMKLVDKIGGTMTSAGMLLTGPGRALGIDSSTKRFEAFADANIMFEERYKAADKAILNMEIAEIKYQDTLMQTNNAITITADAVKKKHAIVVDTSGKEEKAHKEATRAIDEQRQAYESTLDRLLPLEVEQREYNEALAILEKMDPSKSTDRYNTALKNLEAGLTKNIEAEKARNEVAELAIKIREDAVKAEEEAAEAAKRSNDAYREMYADMEKYSKDAAANSLLYQLRSLDEQERAYAQMTGDENVSRQWRLAREQELYDKWSLAHGDFVDGFIVGIHQMADEIPTIGEIGAKTFGMLADSWSDGFYAVVTGDFDSLEDVWDSLLDNMAKMFIDWIADMVFAWAASELTKGLGLDINVGGSLGSGGPSGYANDPVYVTGIGGTGGEIASAGGLGSGDMNDMLGAVGGLTTLFAGGSGWDSVATGMSDNMDKALTSSETFSTSLDSAVNAFGTTTSAWDTVGDNMASTFSTAVDDYFSGDFTGTLGSAWDSAIDNSSAWDNSIKDISLQDMMPERPNVSLSDDAPSQSTIMGQMKPYIQAASSAMAAYGAYNQFRNGDYTGGAVSTMGAASSAYQSGASAGLWEMGSTGTGLVAGAGVVGGLYGVYNGIQSILDEGLTMQNGLSTALSAYSAYTSASALSVSMGGSAFTGAGGLSAISTAIGDGLATVGTTITEALTPAAELVAQEAAKQVAVQTTTQVGGEAVGMTAAEGTGSVAGGVATVAMLAWKAVDMFLVNHDMGIRPTNEQTSTGGTWTYGSDQADANFGSKLEDVIAGAARQSFDNIKDAVPVAATLEQFRGGIDVLTNSFNTGSAELYRALEAGSISFEQYVEKVSGKDVSSGQAAEMQGLAAQAAQGSTQALAALQGELQTIGVESYTAAQAAVAMTSAMEAQASGFETSTSGLTALNHVADAYLDRVALMDVALSDSVAMYDNARVAAEGNASALVELEAQFVDLGMNSTKAAKEAQDMTKAVGMGAQGFSVMASGVMDAIPKLNEGRAEMFSAADDYSYAMKTVGAETAALLYPLGELSYSLKDAFTPMGSLARMTDMLAGSVAGLAGAGIPVSPYATGGIVGYAGGGVLEGGSGTRDDIYLGTVNNRLQMAKGGEYIMPPEQTKKHLSLLKAMNRDEFSVGGMIAGVIGSIGSKTNTGDTWQSLSIPAIGDVLSDLAKIMQPIGNVINGTLEYGEALQDLNNRYADTYASAKEAGATESQLMDIRKARVKELAEMEIEHQKAITDLLKPYRELNSGATDYQISLANITDKYADAMEAGKELGLNTQQLQEIWKAQGIAVQQYKDDLKKPFLESARELIETDGMTDYQKQLRGIEQQYAESILTMRDAGATVTELAMLDKARLIEISNLTRQDIKAEDYATRVDYERALYSMPSFAVGTDYVPQDMIAQIHKGERITPARYNQRSDEGNTQLLEEIRMLRQENRALGEANARNTAQLNRFLARFDDGDALSVRVAA